MPDCVIELLKAIYPTVDWSRVTFYEGLSRAGLVRVATRNPQFHAWERT
ncbi:MAG: hypothetical protein ACOY94_01500 [Bacillota bacterium]